MPSLWKHRRKCSASSSAESNLPCRPPRRDRPIRWYGNSTQRQNIKRTAIEPRPGDRRYVRRNKKGLFKTEVNIGRSLAADRRRTAKTKVSKGQGDRGDT